MAELSPCDGCMRTAHVFVFVEYTDAQDAYYCAHLCPECYQAFCKENERCAVTRNREASLDADSLLHIVPIHRGASPSLSISVRSAGGHHA